MKLKEKDELTRWIAVSNAFHTNANSAKQKADDYGLYVIVAFASAIIGLLVGLSV
jgi:hypothetical protein